MIVKLKAKDGVKWIGFMAVILNLIIYEELYSKHFKTHYNGKPTKRYLKLMKQINKNVRFSASDIEQLFLM